MRSDASDGRANQCVSAENGETIAGLAEDKQMTICHDRDLICNGGFLATPSHLTYGDDIIKAADWVVQKVR